MAIVNARISDELDKSLSLLAKALDRSKSYIISNAIENYIREKLEDIEDADIALGRMKSSNKKLYSSEEVQRILENRYRLLNR